MFRCEVTNEDRAESAQAALNAFEEASGMADAGEDTATILGDLLCNLRHLCAREKIDFARAVAMSQTNFEAEIEEAACEARAP